MASDKNKKTGNRELYQRVREILESARTGVARTVNTTQVVANWLVGREIVEEQQRGEKRAGYGQRLVENLSRQITRDFGPGYSAQNLFYMKQFYLGYPTLLPRLEILHAVRGESSVAAILHAVRGESETQSGQIPHAVPALSALDISDAPCRKSAKSHAPRGLSEKPAEIASAVRPELAIHHAVRGELEIRHTPGGESWQPGQLHSNLSWTHYRMLLRVEKPEARSFYEIEAIQNNWAARELERQINSLLYERLALSRDKKGLLRLARKGQEIQGPLDVFKDPMVLEFLKIPASPKLVESALEEALLNDLQSFLLELGKGFAFLARQERITLEGDHFYIDLVFYHTILKCHVLLDLKVGKLTHQDLGQLQLYVNYFDRERLSAGDNPTLGLILCTDKNDAVVRYTLGADERIFASRYKLHLPSEAELKTELLRELKRIGPPATPAAQTKKKKTKR
jgi:predicted nuclease of restriction endonuclease-like (RecB) superfamily